MHIVVTVRTDPTRGVTAEAFGPWELDKCERERRRLLADFAHRCPLDWVRGRFHAEVVAVRDEVIAP